MPNLAISGLPPAGPLTGPEPAPIVQGGVTVRTPVSDIAGTAPFVAAGTSASRDAAQRFGELFNVRDFGAVGDGLADDEPAFAAADAAGGLFAPAGNYRIATPLTLANPLTLGDSAHLTVDGVTLTLNGSFDCGTRLAFHCIAGGLVILNPAVTAFARPEWWGALPQTGADCFAFINQALAAHGVVALQSAPYFISGTLILDKSNQALIGTRNIFVSPDQESCTRIIMADASATIIQLGPTVFPGSINACPFGQHLENFLAQRDRAPDGPSNATGIRVGFCVQSTARQVRVQDSIFGWQFRGSVAFVGRELFSSRAEAATGGGDRFFAFYVDGNDLSIGAAGGNASLRLYNIAATGTTLVPNSVGFAFDHFFSDLFVYDLETVGCPIGILGVGVLGAGQPEAVGNTDCLFSHPVLDGYTTNGVQISAVNASGSIEIVSPFTAPAAGVTGAAFHFENCAGRIHVIGGQVPMLFGAATANGVEIVNSAGVTIDGTKFLECSGAAVHGFNANQCVLRPQTSNFQNPLHAVVQFATGCNGNIVEAAITGNAGAVSFGYLADDATSNFNEFQCTGLRSSVVAAANKLVSNGVSIIAPGPFTFNNLASGVMA